MAIVCKATYRLDSGTVTLHSEQEPLFSRQKHYQDDPAQSVERPNDVIPFKRRAEIVVVGSAFVPRGQVARVLSVRVVVGDVDKSVDIHGQRTLGLDGNVREGAGWSSMPLRYERAAGGPDTWNPIGVNTNWDQVYGTRSLPQITPRGHFSPNPFATLPPVGFGPLSNQWPIRRDKLGARANAFSEENIESLVLGNDFDAHFFQCAPPDQWLDSIRPDERIVLENLHVHHPRLVTSLPGLLPVVFLSVPGYAPMQIPMRPDTLLIDTDRGIATVTYRGQSLVTSFDAQGTFHLLLQEAGQTITVHQAAAMMLAETRPAEAPAPSTPTPDYQVTKSIRLNELASRAPVMPFGQTPASAPSASTPPASTPRPSFDDDDDDDEEEQKQTNIYKMNVMQTPSPAAKVPRPRTRELPKSFELEQIISGAKSPLPFQGASPSSPPPPPSVPAGQTGLPFGTTLPPGLSTSPVGPAVAQSGPPSNVAPMPPPPVSVLQRPPAPALVGVASASEQARPAPVPALAEAPASPFTVDPAPPKTIGEMHVQAKSAAAPDGLLAASNLASVTTSTDKPVLDKPIADKPGADKPAPALDVIWFELGFLPRMRKQSEWAAFVRPASKPTVPQRGQPLPPPPSADAVEEAAKADVLSILGRAQSVREKDLVPAGAGDKDAALHLLSGTLTFPLDDIEMLKATAKAAAPLAAGDKKLKEVLDTVDEVLKMPLEGAPEVVQSFLLKVRDAWAAANKVLPPDYLVSHTERTLLNQRQYQKRELLDDEWIRALWSTGDGTSIPAYIPAKLAKRLPLFRQFSARVIAEALPQQDMYETHAVALRVVTLARVLTPQDPLVKR